MTGREKLASLMLEMLDFGAMKVTVDDFLHLIPTSQPEMELNEEDSITNVMNTDNYLWDIESLSLHIKNNDVSPLKMVQLVFDIYNSKNASTDSDVEFKSSLMVLLCQLVKTSLINKLATHSKELTDVLLQSLSKCGDTRLDSALCGLILEYSEFGFTPSQILILFKHCYKHDKYSQLLYMILGRENIICNSVVFNDEEQSLTFENLRFSKFNSTFVLSSWIKLDNSTHYRNPGNFTACFDFMTLKNHKGENIIHYAIDTGRIKLVTDAEEQLFISFELEIDKVYNIAFAHFCEGKKKIRVDLYINGILIESKVLGTLFGEMSGCNRSLFSPSKNDSTNKPVSLVVTGPSKHDGIIMELSSVYFVESADFLQWVLFIHMLGVDYSGSFEDSCLLSLLHSSSLVELNLYLNQNSDTIENDFLSKVQFKREEVILVWNSLSNQLSEGKIKYFYRSLQKMVAGFASSYRSLKKEGIVSLDSFNSIGGFVNCLLLIEKSNSSDALVNSLKFLFSILSQNKMIERSFISSSGYEILASLLRSKKEFISIEILDCVLNVVGYNELEPAESIIKNRMAYRSLILDFDLWQTPVLSQNKIVNKFLLFQFTVFVKDSKYHQFNIRQISDMKIVRRILLALKRNDFHEDILPVVNNILLVMLKYNRSPETVKLLLLHVIFTIGAINHKKPNSHKQQMGGELILDILQNLIEDQPKILNVFSFKILFSIMSGTTNMRKVSLKLLVKVLRYNPKAYNKVLSSGGFSVISNLLKDEWDNNDIFVELLSAAFNYKIEFMESPTINCIIHKIPENTLNDVQYPHFFGVLNNLMKFAAFNLQSNLNAKAILILDNYIDMLVSLKRKSNFDKVYFRNEEWVENLIFLSLIIKQKNSPKLYERYSHFLTEILLDRFYVEHKEDDISIIENIYGGCIIEFNQVVIPLLFEKIKSFQSLMAVLVDNKTKAITLCRIFICYFQSYFDADVHNLLYLSNFEMATLVIKRIYLESKVHPKIVPFLKILVREFNKSFITACMFFIANTPNFCEEELKMNILFCCKIFMSHPDIIARSLDDSDFFLLFTVFFKILCFGKDFESLGSNCIRVLLLEKADFEKIIDNIKMTDECKRNCVSILKETLSLNDEQVLDTFSSNGDLTEFVSNYYEKHFKVYSNSAFFNSGSDNLSNYIKLKFQLEKSKKILENDIYPFREFVFNRELKNLNSSLQDEIEDFNQYVSMYKSLKANVSFPTQDFHRMLYPTEGKDRKRNKILKVLSNAEHHIFDKGALQKNSVEYVVPELPRSLAKDKDDQAIIKDLDESTYALNANADEDFDEDKNRRILRNLFVHDRIDEVYNVTQIVGLETIEAILVLGGEHIYIVEGYFYSGNGEICCNYEAPDEQRDSVVKLLTDLSISNQQDSCLTKKSFSFHKTKSWSVGNLVSASKRKFLLRDVGFELFFKNGSSILLTCINSSKRNSIFNKISSYITSKLEDINLDEALKLASRQKIKSINKNDCRGSDSTENKGFNIVDIILSGSSDIASSDLTVKWCNGELSNFQYLMLLNTIAGRTFNDMTQYPVFPFVLSDYVSDHIDLNDANIYRDLSKPMGAQSFAREQQFKERYEATKEMSADTPPFHYGTHYSSAMIVTSYLIRLHPFTESYLKLQGGKFDHPDRLFYSIPKLWNSASQDNTTDVRELIPEFYYLPEFLKNSNKFQFGNLQDGKTVNDVELPPWANGDPIKFVRIMRDALESDYVSEHLHEWIDLIFGYKQQGTEAINATNVFHYLSYPGSIDIEKIHDSHERAVIVSIIHNFGQTPLQIFRKKHPKKNLESYVNKVNIKESFMLNFRNVWDTVRGSKPQIQQSGSHVRQVVLNTKSNKWMCLDDNIFYYYENEFSLKIERVGLNGLIINDSFCIEQFTTGGFIGCIKLLSKERFIVGFNTGNLAVYELSQDRFKYVTNAQRSMVKLDYNFSVGMRKKKLFQGFQNKNIKHTEGNLTLLEIGNLRCGHNERIIKIEYLRNDRVLISLDCDRKWLGVWHEPDKFEMEDGEISQMNRLYLDEGDDTIVDFKACEDDSVVYCITNKDKLVVWSINSGVVFKGLLGLTHCKSLHLCENATGKDYRSGQLFVVGLVDERGKSKLVVCYLSRNYEKVEIVLELDSGDDYEFDDAVAMRNTKFGEFEVVLGTAQGARFIR